MNARTTLARMLGTVLIGVVAIAAPVAAQDLVIDANIFYDNAGGAFSADSCGAPCVTACGFGYGTSTLATQIFDNQTIDPLLNPAALLDRDNPRWDPQVNSPLLAGNPNFRAVQVNTLDPWFDDVCYTGALPYTGGLDSQDWTTGWTYYNYDGGLGRTDIDTTKTSVVLTTGFITSDTTWTNTTNIVLSGRVAVAPGFTLTIQPGTVVLGDASNSYLVIERDANIDAQGTAQAPIIFTSAARWQDGDQAAGDWGGVVIHGNAVANCAGFSGCGLTTTEGDCESEGGAGFFGGSDDSDNSGIIRYARVEYAGNEISTDNELNAWTMNAVGSGTVLEHMQSHIGLDDMFEWFGGTARMKYLVATGGDDDNFDFQMGYRGYVQFAVCQQAGSDVASNEDSGIEGDNNEFDDQCPGVSDPTFSNLTLVGSANRGSSGRGMRIRVGAACHIVNSVATGFGSQGLRVQDTATFDNCPGVTTSDINCALVAVAEPIRPAKPTVLAAPNPVRGISNLNFSLAGQERVQVQVFDISGRLVEQLVDGVMPAGDHDVRWDATDVPAGVYFYRVQTARGETTGKLMVTH